MLSSSTYRVDGRKTSPILHLAITVRSFSSFASSPRLHGENIGLPWRDIAGIPTWSGLWALQYLVSKLFVLMLCMPAFPGATGFGYATVFTAYQCIAFHHRILTCQVWARECWNSRFYGQAVLSFLSMSCKCWDWFRDFRQIPDEARASWAQKRSRPLPVSGG